MEAAKARLVGVEPDVIAKYNVVSAPVAAQMALGAAQAAGAEIGISMTGVAGPTGGDVWAIGTGETATSDQAEEVCAAIRNCIKEVYDEATAEAIRIQYGGSVNAGNAAELFAKPDIDGGLVGGKSSVSSTATTCVRSFPS